MVEAAPFCRSGQALRAWPLNQVLDAVIAPEKYAPPELLYLLAEVSIATVALSGITMVLAVSSFKMTSLRASQIATQLRMSFIVTTFSILPILLHETNLDPVVGWRVASACYMAAVCFMLFRAFVLAETYSQLPSFAYRLTALTGTCALVLLPLNIWFVDVWPYLAQLFIAWVTSMTLFVRFIVDVLSDNSEEGI